MRQPVVMRNGCNGHPQQVEIHSTVVAKCEVDQFQVELVRKGTLHKSLSIDLAQDLTENRASSSETSQQILRQFNIVPTGSSRESSSLGCEERCYL